MYPTDRIEYGRAAIWKQASERSKLPTQENCAAAGAVQQPAAKGVQKASTPAAQSAGLPDIQDRNDISPNWEQAVDWQQSVQDLLNMLQKTYGKVNIIVSDLNDIDALKNYAASLGSGAHLVLSQDFLNKMATGAKSFFKGKEILTGLMRQLSSQANSTSAVGAYVSEEGITFWAAEPPQKIELPKPGEKEFKTLFEMMEELRQKAEKQKEAFRLKVGNSIYYSPADSFSKLAHANTESGVRGVIASAERNMYSLRLAISLGPDKDKAKARAALAALEKVVIRASGKIKDLREEEIIRRQQKRAQQRNQERKAEQIKFELKKKQSARRAREHAQITEGMPWFYYQQELMRQKQIVDREEFQAEIAAVDMAGIDIGTAGGAALSGGEASFTAADVSVSPTVAISI